MEGHRTCDLLQLWSQAQHVACGQPGIEESRDGAWFHGVSEATEERLRIVRLALFIVPRAFFRVGTERAPAGRKQSRRNASGGHSFIFRLQSRDPLSARYRSSRRHRQDSYAAPQSFHPPRHIRTIPVRGFASKLEGRANQIRKAETGCQLPSSLADRRLQLTVYRGD